MHRHIITLKGTEPGHNGIHGDFLLWDFSVMTEEDNLMILNRIKKQESPFVPSEMLAKYGLDLMPFAKTCIENGIDDEILDLYY